MRRDKTVATWLAVIGGALGLHRFYLHGMRDPVGWLHPPATLAGLAGVVRMANLGQDDRIAWALIPLLGLSISAGMAGAIVHALTPDDRWAARHGQPPRATRWGPVLGAISALFLGAGVLLATIAFGVQKFFEWQLDPARAAAAAPRPTVASAPSWSTVASAPSWSTVASAAPRPAAALQPSASRSTR